MARIGLRMMPTFPSPPLRFRTAGFPRYGLKAGISGEACPVQRVCLRPSCWLPSSRFPALCQGRCGQLNTSMRAVLRSTPGALAPAGLCCPGPLRLTGPMRPARRRIPTSPPCGLYEMPSLYRMAIGIGYHEELSGCPYPVLRRKHWPSTRDKRLGIPTTLTLRS